MSDLSALSDEELKALYAGQPKALSDMSDADLKAAYDKAPHPASGPSGDWWTDLKRRIGTAATDALAGYLAVPRMSTQAVDWLGRQVGLNPGASDALGSIRDPADASRPLFPTFPEARDMAFATTGATEYVPETRLGRAVQAGLTGVIAAGKPSAMIAGGVGGAAGQQAAEEVIRQGGGEAAATITGLAAGMGAGALANRGAQIPFGVPPSNVRPEQAALARRAQELGIPVTPADISESASHAKQQQMLLAQGFPRSLNAQQAQRQAYNRRVTAQMGEDAPAPTPEVMQRTRTRIGSVFDRVAADTEITPQATNTLAQNLAAIETEARTVLTDAEFGPLRRQLDNALSPVQQNGTISGASYQALTRRGAPLDVAQQSNNPNIAHYASRIRAALDDALEQSATPENVAALRTARQQWRAMRTIDANLHGADTAESAATLGDVNPQTLYRQVLQTQQRYGGPDPAYTPLGQNEMIDLGKIGQGILKAPRSSGSPEGILAGQPPWMRIARQPFVGSVNYLADILLNSERLANRQINAALHPPSVVFRQPNPLVKALLAERAAQLGTHPPTTQ